MVSLVLMLLVALIALPEQAPGLPQPLQGSRRWHWAARCFLALQFFQNPAEMEQWRDRVLACAAPKRIEKPGMIGRWC